MSKYFLIYTVFYLFILQFSLAAEIKIINDGLEALNTRIALIEEATETIEMSYFILANDEVSHLILAKLREASRRGVEVRILIDQLFNKMPKAIENHLLHENIEIREFNIVKIKKLKHITRRLHDKIFIVDGKHAILGGRNIENTYYDLSDGKKNYDDRDIYIVGSDVIQSYLSYFDELWLAPHLTNRTIKKVSTKKLKKAEEAIDKALEYFQDQRSLFSLDQLELTYVEDTNFSFAHDKIQLVKDRTVGTANTIYQLISNAKESVYIDSPYFILTPKSREVFADAISKGVKIRLITNSLSATDGIAPQAAYLSQRKKILAMGIEVYEYYGDYSFHSKSLVIDGEIALIGSFNFDYISERNNTESMVIIRDSDVAKELAQDMETTLHESRKITLNEQSRGENHRYAGPSLKKKVLTSIIRYIFVPIIKTQL